MSGSSDRVRHSLGPAALDVGGPLFTAWVDTIADELEDIAQLVRSRPGREGWADATDLQRTPSLPWLLQWAGVTYRADLTAEQNRQRAVERPESRRGTAAYVRASVREHLTGGRHVDLFERDQSDPRALRVRVYAAEVVDQAQLQQAVDRAVPWTIRATLEVVQGWSVDQTVAAYSTVDALAAGVPTVDELSYRLP